MPEEKNDAPNEIQGIVSRIIQSRESMMESGELSECHKCKGTYPAKWGSCPECSQSKKISMEAINMNLCVPTLYAKAYLGTFKPEHQEIIDGICNGKIQDAFLHGTPGTGKTFLATAALQLAAQSDSANKLKYQWRTFPGILANIRDTYNDKSHQTEKDVIESFTSIDLLLIDDLGAEKVTDWSISAFYQIISDRINWCKRTIITSNLDIQSIAKWNDRIASRLSIMEVVQITGKDRRIKQKED